MLTGRAPANLDWPSAKRGDYLTDIPQSLSDFYWGRGGGFDSPYVSVTRCDHLDPKCPPPSQAKMWKEVVDGDDDSQVVGQGMQEGPEPESGDGRTVCAHPGPQCARGWDRRTILGILVNFIHFYPRTPPMTTTVTN